MMHTLAHILDPLFGLRELSLSDPEVSLQFARPLPSWAWAMIVLTLLAFAGWSYSKLLGPRLARIALAGLRTCVLLLIVMLLVGPQLVRTDERVDPDWVLMLTDASASMAIADMANESGEPLTRDAAMRMGLEAQRELFETVEAEPDRRLGWYRFDARLQSVTQDVAQWPTPTTPATSLRTVIEQLLDETAGKPIGAVVLMSDGRTPQPTGRDLTDHLRKLAVPVYTVPLGASPMPLDFSVTRIDAPDRAFVGDIVPVKVQVDQTGGDPADAARVTVRLVESQTGRVLDEKMLSQAEGDQPLRLSGVSDAVGRATWRVEAIYEPSIGGEPERLTDNNADDFTLEFIDRPIRVLYVDAYPRWEYRYLKSVLVREKSIDSSILLLSADRSFGQEGDTPIARLPADAQEMQPFDVIILGDVPAGYFTADQMTLFRDQVAIQGAGLLLLGGPRSMPTSYEGTVLVDLFPMRDPAAAMPFEPRAMQLKPTSQASTLNVLQLRGPSVDGGWPTDLSPIRWVQQLGSVKQTAETLAVVSDTLDPLLLRMRYGAGQSLYLATDETWRWRYGRGDLYFEQFWMQLVRMLGQARVQQADDLAALRLSHRRVNVDDAVLAELEILDATLKQNAPAEITLSVTDPARPDQPAEPIALRRHTDVNGSGRVVYQSLWRPGVSGLLTVRLSEPALEHLNLAREIDVVALDDEMRQVQPDHERLKELAEQTGGRVVALDELEQIFRHAPRRARITPNDVSETLWNSGLSLALILLLLTAEWIVRRWIRLA